MPAHIPTPISHPGEATSNEIRRRLVIVEALVVEADQVQDGGVQVVDVDLVLHSAEAEVIGRVALLPPRRAYQFEEVECRDS